MLTVHLESVVRRGHSKVVLAVETIPLNSVIKRQPKNRSTTKVFGIFSLVIRACR